MMERSEIEFEWESEETIREEAAKAAAEESDRVLDEQITAQNRFRGEAVDLVKIDLTALGLIFSARAFRPEIFNSGAEILIPSIFLVMSMIFALFAYGLLNLSTGIAGESYDLLMSEKNGNVYKVIAEQHAESIKHNQKSAQKIKKHLSRGWVSAIIAVISLLLFAV